MVQMTRGRQRLAFRPVGALTVQPRLATNGAGTTGDLPFAASLPETAPVPPAKDTLTGYDTQPVSSGVRAHGCLSKNGEWTLLHARRPGTYVLTSDFDVIPNQKQRGGTCPEPSS